MNDIKIIANELHKQRKKVSEFRKVLSNHKNQYWAIDLIEMQEYSKVNKGYNYILVCVDIYTRFCWVEPIKTKTGKETSNTLQKIINKASDPPEKFYCDSGTEFYNKDVDELRLKYNIGIYSTYGKSHSSIVERFNKTLKNTMYKIFTENGDRVWYNILNDIVDKYNNTKHSTIKTTPSNAYNNNIQLYMNEIDDRKETTPKFKLNDRVRVAYNKEVFQKGYHVGWSHQIYLISEVLPTKPTTYKIKDERGDEYKGSFYSEELQLTKQSKDIYLVEKIIKSEMRKGKKWNFVKYQGYNDSWNEWIPDNQVAHQLKNISKLKN
jgi:hypothetical protein